MKSGSHSSNPGDDVTSAAESLLGIDLSSSQMPSVPIDLDDSDLFGEPDVEPPPQVAEEPASAVDELDETVADSAAPNEDFDSDFGDFGAGLDAIPEPAPVVARKPQPSTAAKPVPRAVKTTAVPATDESVADEGVAEESRTEEPADAETADETAAPAARKDDSYWDALEGWDWGEESAGTSDTSAPNRGGRGRSAGRPRGRPERPERPERRREERAPPPAARARPASGNDEFGAGIDDEPNAGTPEPDPDVSAFELNPTESQVRSVGRERGRRPERPGRRPRIRSAEDFDDKPKPARGKADTEESVFEIRPTESQARSLDRPSERRSERPAAEADDGGDDFGAGLDDRPSTRRQSEGSEPAAGDGDDREARRGRRRRGRGRGRDAGRSESTSEAQAPADGRRETASRGGDSDHDSQRSEFRDEDVAEVGESQFTDVPTWADAIGLLVKSRGGTSDAGSSARGGRSTSSSGDRGGRGRGRGGRRGGKRRSE